MKKINYKNLVRICNQFGYPLECLNLLDDNGNKSKFSNKFNTALEKYHQSEKELEDIIIKIKHEHYNK